MRKALKLIVAVWRTGRGFVKLLRSIITYMVGAALVVRCLRLPADLADLDVGDSLQIGQVQLEGLNTKGFCLLFCLLLGSLREL